MDEFKGFEKDVIAVLTSSFLSDKMRTKIFEEGEVYDVDFTGAGYFVHCRLSELPKERSVHNEPMLSGTAGDAEGGFVVFIMDHELTLECHTWMENFPADFRDRDVSLSVS